VREGALDRVARALNLIPFITHNPGLSVVQIAERFNSTPAQISKDLSLLHMCGLPGYSHLELLDIDYEDPEYVSVTDAQVLDQPRSLTQVEALTLVLGLQALSELSTNPEERLAITNLQSRIGALYENQISAQITISDAVVESPVIAEVDRAIREKRFVTIEYNSASSDSLTTRTIFPLDLFYLNGIAYLHAIGVAEGEERTFRIDRIQNYSTGEIDAEFANGFTSRNHASDHKEVQIEMGEDGLFFIEKHNEIVTSSNEVGGIYQITLTVTPGEWILRTLLAWPSPITVVQPASLSQQLRERIAGTLANYQ
jgi:proteasome accessory factor C